MDKTAELKDIALIMKQRLGPSRWLHSLGVAETAQKLALANNADAETAYLAGLVHDYGRKLEDSELLQIARTNLQLKPEDLVLPSLLHGPVAAYLLPTELGIANPVVLAAVANHTLGRVEMSKLEQIIFIADMIEPSRSFPGIEELRTTVYRDLTAGVLAGFNQTIAHIAAQNQYLHPRTVEARNYIWQQIQAEER